MTYSKKSLYVYWALYVAILVMLYLLFKESAQSIITVAFFGFSVGVFIGLMIVDIEIKSQFIVKEYLSGIMKNAKDSPAEDELFHCLGLNNTFMNPSNGFIIEHYKLIKIKLDHVAIANRIMKAKDRAL